MYVKIRYENFHCWVIVDNMKEDCILLEKLRKLQRVVHVLCALCVVGFKKDGKVLLFLNQRKRKHGRRNYSMTESPRKNVPDVGIELHAKRTRFRPSYHARLPSTCNVVRNAFGHLIRAPNYFNTIGWIRFIYGLMIGRVQRFFQHQPHPHSWPVGQGHGLGSL